MERLLASLLTLCFLLSAANQPAPPQEPEPEYTPVPPVETRVTSYSAKSRHKVTVLMYHHLVQTEAEVNGNSMVVTAQRFEEDLRWLADNGYTAVLPRDLVEGVPLPKKAVMITLDDGYRSNYELAFPILQKLETKAVIAVICGKLDQEAPTYLTWDMCREMSMSGLVEFGSHTYWLHNLDERNGAYIAGGPNGIQRLKGESRENFQARVIDDLEKSARRLEDELGNEVLYFAYPYGVKDSWAADYIAGRFAMTVLTREGVADLSKGFYSLPRKTVSMDRRVSRCF